jgi:ferredoxin
MSERLHVDWTRCTARGLCVELLPELLTTDDWGYPRFRRNPTDPTVPPRLSGYAEAAVTQCPRQALRLLPGSPRPEHRQRPG